MGPEEDSFSAQTRTLAQSVEFGEEGDSDLGVAGKPVFSRWENAYRERERERE